MPEVEARTKHLLWMVVLIAVALLIGVGIFPARVEHVETAPIETTPRAKDSVSTSAPSTAPRIERSEETRSREEPATRVPDDIPLLDRDQEIALRWSQIDLDEVRAEMPDNLFWKLSAPTSDEDILREREEERARWNEDWGQVLSGNASEVDIQDYYAQRHRISSDYVEFASHLLTQYGDILPAHDVGLLEFSVQMHQSRLQQMPRRLIEALERKEKLDRLREEWRADEVAFEQALLEEAERDKTPPRTR